MKPFKNSCFLVLVILFLLPLVSGSEHESSRSYVVDATCGDNLCSEGENTLNCPVDCEVNSFTYSINYDETRNPLILYNNSQERLRLTITNSLNSSLSLNVSHGPVLGFFLNETGSREVRLAPEEEQKVSLLLRPDSSRVNHSLYNKEFRGIVTISSERGEVVRTPVRINVVPSYDTSLIDVRIVDNTVSSLDSLVYVLDFTEFSQQYAFRENVSMNVSLDTPQNRTVFLGEQEVDLSGENKEFYIPFSSHNTSNLSGVEGTYSLDFEFLIGENLADQDYSFSYQPIFWTEVNILYAIVVLTVLGFGGFFIYAYARYQYYKLKNARYITPNMRLLPQPTERSFWLGTVGGTNKPAYFNIDDLLTHGLVAGSTGSGKSVTSSVLVEGILDMNIPVVVFDPTAQWTGFLSQNRDENILKMYSQFNMKEDDVKSYKGIIYNVTDPNNLKLDFNDYMNPGEITVFNLNSLKAGEYDVAVKNIVDTIFKIQWEETGHLRLLIVFDEVHRLLEKYGGSGGYVALEKAVREFRKWGIGMLMASQVSADFKEALQGNVLTEVQLNTKSMEDINKIKTKYGEIFSERITRMNVGTVLFQNPHYNDGRPWFVNVRPPAHSPHKLSDELLQKYTKYSDYLKKVEHMLEQLKERGEQVDDVMMDLRLAKGKLKEGRFRMVEIYIENLNNFLKKYSKGGQK